MAAVRITCITRTPEGGSAFAELDIDLADGGAFGLMSDLWPAQGVVFRESAGDSDHDWHCAPQRQLIVLLDGEIEVEVTSGEKRRFRGGDVVLAEDTTGTGHRTRTVSSGPRRSLFIPMLPRDIG
jgi:hypothetical protein